MTDYPRLVRDLHAKHGDLDAVADVLGWSKGTWSLIANGKRDPTRAQMNAIRAAVGMELLPPKPVEYRLHDEPDAAFLVNLDGKQPERVRVVTVDAKPQQSFTPQLRVALRNVNAKKNGRSTVSIHKPLMKRLTGAKIRHGGTWDQFMSDMLEKWEDG